MNYYERHLGDYAKDAAHLSMLEHGAYTLLLDRYYTTEQPIPADQAHRVCRARTKEEREAVDAVLAEFFQLEDGHWVNGRASREISKMQAKVKAAQENGKRGGRPKQTEQKPSGFLLGSVLETQQKAHQTPVTSNQIKHTEDVGDRSAVRALEAAEQDGHEPTPAGTVCRAMRAAGLSQTNPGDPRLLELLRQGATEAELVGLAAEAAGKGKGFAWALVTLAARRREAAEISLAPKPEDKAGQQAVEETARLLAEQRAKPKTAAPAHVRELLNIRKGAARA